MKLPVCLLAFWPLAIAQAEPLPISDFRQTAGSHFGASAQLMKAVMPPTRGATSFENSVAHKPASSPRLTQKNVLVKSGKLRRLAQGLYDFPKVHPKLGPLSPAPDDVAQALARETGSQVQIAGARAAASL